MSTTSGSPAKLQNVLDLIVFTYPGLGSPAGEIRKKPVTNLWAGIIFSRTILAEIDYEVVGFLGATKPQFPNER